MHAPWREAAPPSEPVVPPLDILALVTDAFGGRGGIARYNIDLISALAASERVAQITVLPRAARDTPTGIPRNVQQRAPRFGRLSYAAGALSEVRKLGKDPLIFCGHIRMAPLAAALAKRYRLPLWLQVHGLDAWGRPAAPVRAGAEYASLVTSVSRFTKAKMVENWWGADPLAIRVLPNTYGAEFEPGPKPAEIIERHGLAGHKVIMTVCRLSWADRYKGLDLVISSFANVLERHPDAVYLIVGGGNDMERLQRAAETFGVAGSVRFAGHVPAESLPAYYRAAEVFIMPSTKEGFGIVFLEAAASGCRVIAGDRDGSIDAAADGRIARLVDPEDRFEIAEAICSALDKTSPVPDPEIVSLFRAAAFARHVDALVGTYF